MVDIKEREERSAVARLQQKERELTAQKEAINLVTRENNENLIRLENNVETIKTLKGQAAQLKSELSDWKKYTGYAAIVLLGIIIGLLIKMLV